MKYSSDIAYVCQCFSSLQNISEGLTPYKFFGKNYCIGFAILHYSQLTLGKIYSPKKIIFKRSKLISVIAQETQQPIGKLKYFFLLLNVIETRK